MATEPTPLYNLPDGEQAAQLAAERKADAKKHFNAIRKAGELESTSSMRIGWNAHYLKVNSLFGILGFSTEEEARIAAGVGRSTWYSNIALAEAFQGIEEEQFITMKQANAKALVNLPESKRLSREWIREAGSDSIEKFTEKCEVALNGKAKASDGKEHGTVLKMPMPQSSKTVIDEGLKEYASRVGVEDTGKALELMVTEHTGQVGLIEAVTTTAQRLKAAKQLQDSGLSAEETLVKVYELIDAAILDLSASLEAVQNLDSNPASLEAVQNLDSNRETIH